jgi:sugar-specific transcriptional regulator TrmB
MLKDNLMDLGLSKKEAYVYIICLEFSTAPASVIAKKSEIKRETCYYILKKLIDK